MFQGVLMPLHDVCVPINLCKKKKKTKKSPRLLGHSTFRLCLHWHIKKRKKSVTAPVSCDTIKWLGIKCFKQGLSPSLHIKKPWWFCFWNAGMSNYYSFHLQYCDMYYLFYAMQVYKDIVIQKIETAKAQLNQPRGWGRRENRSKGKMQRNSNKLGGGGGRRR